MREIKFRGKNINKDEWVYGGYYKYQEDIQIIHIQGVNASQHTEVVPETVGQFTGLKDINGVDIYEGDIVEGISNNEFSKGMIDDYEIMWGIDSWYVKGTYFSLQELFNYCNNKVKVISNIYEKLNRNE